MKTWIPLFLLITVCVAAGCDKDAATAKTLRGTWELSSSTNGMTGQVTPYEKGNGRLLRFGDRSYEMFTENKETRSGTYTLSREKSLLTGETGQRIIYDGNTGDVHTFFTIGDDGLHILIDAYDAPSSNYRRVE